MYFFGFLHHSNLAPSSPLCFDATRHTACSDVVMQPSNLLVCLKMEQDAPSPQQTSPHPIPSMSPLLSNIFQNDLHDIFAECDAIVLENISFNSISWVNDLLLISTSKEGLQRCLDKLHGYCAKWGLEVNVSKTKSMVLSKSHFNSENFRYGNLDIERVRSIQYLVFSITYNLNLKCIMSDRISKA